MDEIKYDFADRIANVAAAAATSLDSAADDKTLQESREEEAAGRLDQEAAWLHLRADGLAESLVNDEGEIGMTSNVELDMIFDEDDAFPDNERTGRIERDVNVQLRGADREEARSTRGDGMILKVDNSEEENSVGEMNLRGEKVTKAATDVEGVTDSFKEEELQQQGIELTGGEFQITEATDKSASVEGEEKLPGAAMPRGISAKGEGEWGTRLWKALVGEKR